ncbi:helix-turn-helix domain-containing protein [Streptomyces marincola]|uniref:helix-turn-helix domain-containing protein n=1 Tax=Streptomyces marincola TaxID=2878388 RepID=UPI001CF59BF9|nr:helix-turn-helix transcriptional regulator [Streptomyces marincola]UCM89929.1 helix-turn-helix domain-containing protein [Streptomyces marincola]
MPQWSEYTNGQRIKVLRGAELRQPDLAEMTGLSVVTIQKAEQDKALSLTTLLKIASALGVDTSVILGQQEPRRAMSQDDRAMVRALSRAVHDSWVGLVPATAVAVPANELRDAVDRCWAMYWEGRYAEAGAVIAPLLAAAAAHRHDQPHDRQASANGLLSDAYRLAAYVAGARLGSEHRAHGTVFGPVSATTQAVGINLGLGRVGNALALVESTTDVSPLSEAAQNRYAMDKAMVQAEAKMWDASLDTLEETLRRAPAWARHQALPGMIVRKVGAASTARLRQVSTLIGAQPTELGGFAPATEKSVL